MTASERRNAILEDLCMRRYEKVSNLAFQFGVSEKTIRRDILTLSLEYPIYTAQGNGGGIYVDKNFRLGRVYFKNEQQELLERLLPGLIFNQPSIGNNTEHMPTPLIVNTAMKKLKNITQTLKI